MAQAGCHVFYWCKSCHPMCKLVCLEMTGWIKIQDRAVPGQTQLSVGWPRSNGLELWGINHIQSTKSIVCGCTSGILLEMGGGVPFTE